MKYNATIMKMLDHMPKRMRQLPISDKGYPVPWFVSKVKDGRLIANSDPDGSWNFVGIDQRKPMEAVRRNICWVCGRPLGRYKTFVIGPMCAVNRVTSEPPVHMDCGEFSAEACPFLSKPRMTRNYKTMPEEERNNVPGIPIDRNPGVCLVWTTLSYELMRLPNGTLFSLGDPTSLSWWYESRRATREEIDRSIAGGLPILREMAEKEGPDAMAEFQRRWDAAQLLLPT